VDKRTFLRSLGATAAWAANGHAAFAQSGRSTRIIVPLAAGSANDYVARVISPYLTASLSQPVVVDNKAGANGIVGTMEAVRAAPDGNTLLLASVSPLAVNLALYTGISYDPRRDLTPLAGVSSTANVLMVKSSLPVKTFPEFLDYVKKQPSFAVGSSTAATTLQIKTINRMAGIDMQIIPYRGAPAALNDVLGDTLGATFCDPGLALAQTKGGQMRALAVSSLKRNPVTPDWPAMSETLPGFDMTFWTVMAGPAGMSRDAVQRISTAVMDAVKQKEVTEKFAQSGTLPFLVGPEEVKSLFVTEIARWTKMARDANVAAEPFK
jgi:tripartite-type tricarboxylate transporter receptor subunit TctC